MSSSRGNPILALVLMVLFGGVFTYLGGRDVLRDFQFDKTPERSTAVVDRLWFTHGSKGGTGYHANYHYPVNGFVLHVGDVTMSRAAYVQLSAGQQVSVKYLVEDPATSRVDLPGEDAWHRRNDEVTLAVGLLVLTVALLHFFFGKTVR